MSETGNNEVDENKKEQDVTKKEERFDATKSKDCEDGREESTDNENEESGENTKKSTKSVKKAVNKEKQSVKKSSKKVAPKENLDNGNKAERKEVKEKQGDDDDDKEGDESSEEDTSGNKKLPWLDQPLEVTGSRERKKVERLNISFNVSSKEKKLEFTEGDGERLGDCPIIEENINKIRDPEVLKFIHRFLFGRPGSIGEIKKNLKRFNGFTFKRDSPDYDRKKNLLEKTSLKMLKTLVTFCDLHDVKSKDDMVSALMEFLLKPKASGRLPNTKKESNTKRKKAKKGASKKSSTTKKSSESEEEDDEEEEEEEEEEVDEEEEDEAEKDEENDKEASLTEEDEKNDKQSSENDIYESPEEESESENDDDDSDYGSSKTRKKGKRIAKRKAPSRKKPQKKSVVKKDISMNEDKKPTQTQAKRKKVEVEDDDSSEDDKPLLKKNKSPPTDEDLKNLIKKILDGANLEEITMKTVCKQVYAAYPDFDLSDRKDFIKATVRSIIS